MYNFEKVEVNWQEVATLEFDASWSNFFRGGRGGGISGSSLSLCKLLHELKKDSRGGKNETQFTLEFQNKTSS